jgi:phage gp36-like protein
MNKLPITLQPITTVASSGSGESVDIGELRAAAKLRVVVAALEGTDPSLIVRVETSPDDLTWRTVDSVAMGAASSAELVVVGLDRYVRAVWTLTGSYVTLGVSGGARQLFATEKDLESLSLGSDILEDADQQKKNRALVHGSDLAAGYLGAQYDMPLLSWGDDLSGHTAAVSAYRFMVSIGFAPEGSDEHIRTMYEDAIRWFERVAEGKIAPDDIVDSAPEQDTGGAFVYTKSLRGW